MGNKFAEIAFTPGVRAIQQSMGGSKHYDRLKRGDTPNEMLGPVETNFISQRDNFYIASVSETGWPYIQHRGGPPGFLKVLTPTTVGFADYRGNRQYVSAGNLSHDDRVALILVDYPNRRRLKILGHVQVIPIDAVDALTQITTPGYRARVERGFIIKVVAFDWNCPQHITPRYSQGEIKAMVSEFEVRVAALEQQLRDCKASR